MPMTLSELELDPDTRAMVTAFLKDRGIDLESLEASSGQGVRVVCVAASLEDTLRKMGDTARDQVLMVRTDRETVAQLDTWVDAGIARSRSEAAALFLRQGLQVRAGELDELTHAIRDLETARKKLRDRARSLLG